MTDDIKIRLATPADQPGIIELIDGVYREYGDTVCLEDAESDLTRIDETYFSAGGAFWVLEADGQIAGSHAIIPTAEKVGVCNFKRLYLAQALRGTDWGHRLMQITVDWAREHGFTKVEFWSDTRFTRAHRFFEKFGFSKTGEIREMHDGTEPYREYFYFLDL